MTVTATDGEASAAFRFSVTVSDRKVFLADTFESFDSTVWDSPWVNTGYSVEGALLNVWSDSVGIVGAVRWTGSVQHWVVETSLGISDSDSLSTMTGVLVDIVHEAYASIAFAVGRVVVAPAAPRSRCRLPSASLPPESQGGSVGGVPTRSPVPCARLSRRPRTAAVVRIVDMDGVSVRLFLHVRDTGRMRALLPDRGCGGRASDRHLQRETGVGYIAAGPDVRVAASAPRDETKEPKEGSRCSYRS